MGHTEGTSRSLIDPIYPDMGSPLGTFQEKHILCLERNLYLTLIPSSSQIVKRRLSQKWDVYPILLCILVLFPLVP
jgi:hypothetical protein